MRRLDNSCSFTTGNVRRASPAVYEAMKCANELPSIVMRCERAVAFQFFGSHRFVASIPIVLQTGLQFGLFYLSTTFPPKRNVAHDFSSGNTLQLESGVFDMRYALAIDRAAHMDGNRVCADFPTLRIRHSEATI